MTVQERTAMHSKVSAKVKMLASLRLKLKNKNKIKEIPFNISSPWGESIASYLGTTLDELKANMPADPTLESAVQSTCSLVRDWSVKTLVMKNKKAIAAFKDICYGSGYMLSQKKLVMTGGCKWHKGPKDEAPIELGDEANTIVGVCANAEAPMLIKRMYDAVPVPKPKQNGSTQRLYTKHLLGGDAPVEGVFMQTGQTSNDLVPN